MDAAGDATEKGALGSVLPDGAKSIPAKWLKGGISDGGRPERMDRMCQPLAVGSLPGQHGTSKAYPALSNGEENELTRVGASGGSEEASRVVDAQDSSDSLSQDIEKGNVYNAQAIASLEGGSDEEMQRTNHILLLSAVEQSLEQQPGNSNHPHPRSKGKDVILLGAAAGAGPGADHSKSEKVSRVVEHQRSSDELDLDIEKGKVRDAEAIAGRDVEGGTRYPHQPDNDDDSVCRICHMNFASAEILNLGCACKLDLGQAHKRCADTWFAFRGNRECEICGEVARNVKPPELAMDGSLDPETVVILNNHYRTFARWMCIRLLVICLVWVAVVFLLYKLLLPSFRKVSHQDTSV